MKKLNVLIINSNERQRSEWKFRLEKTGGYHVAAVHTDLSGMVYHVSREKIHIVLCASSLIKDNAYVVLKGAMEFFPRVKIVVVGDILLQTQLPKLTNIVIMRSFDCSLRELFDFPDNLPEELDKEDALRLLLGDHFLTPCEAETVLEIIGPHWTPEFAVIAIRTDRCADTGSVIRVLGELCDPLSLCEAVTINANEVCAVLDRSPDTWRCLDIANAIRLRLLQKTDAGFSIGVSRSRRRVDELFACRKEALRAAGALHLYGRDSVIHISYLDDNDTWYAYPHHKERKLIECTLDGNCDGAVKLLDELFSFLDEHDNLHKRYANKIAMRIWSDLNLAASSRVKAFETAQMDFMSFGKMLASKSRQDVYRFLKDGIVGLADEMIEIANVRRDILFVKLSELQRKGGDVAIPDITKDFHTTVGFLNDAISRNSDKNIFDFFRNGQKQDKSEIIVRS